MSDDWKNVGSSEHTDSSDQLEALSGANPRNADIALRFVQSLGVGGDRAELERTFSQLVSVEKRFADEEKVLTQVAHVFANAALSRWWVQEKYPDLSDEASRRFGAIARGFPESRSLAQLRALLAQDQLRRETEPDKRARLTKELSDLHTQFPDMQGITDAYQLSTPRKGGCYVATAIYGSYDAPEVWTLRRFRDRTLASSRPGRLFIRVYYATSPTLVRTVGRRPWFSGGLRPVFDWLVARLNGLGYDRTPHEDTEQYPS